MMKWIKLISYPLIITQGSNQFVDISSQGSLTQFEHIWAIHLWRPKITRTVRKSDYTPALALPKHMAGILDEKCRKKEK